MNPIVQWLMSELYVGQIMQEYMGNALYSYYITMLAAFSYI